MMVGIIPAIIAPSLWMAAAVLLVSFLLAFWYNVSAWRRAKLYPIYLANVTAAKQASWAVTVFVVFTSFLS
jgi:hypothetical protein